MRSYAYSHTSHDCALAVVLYASETVTNSPLEACHTKRQRQTLGISSCDHIHSIKSQAVYSCQVSCRSPKKQAAACIIFALTTMYHRLIYGDVHLLSLEVIRASAADHTTRSQRQSWRLNCDTIKYENSIN